MVVLPEDDAVTDHSHDNGDQPEKARGETCTLEVIAASSASLAPYGRVTSSETDTIKPYSCRSTPDVSVSPGRERVRSGGSR